jgi:hypothetical protein
MQTQARSRISFMHPGGPGQITKLAMPDRADGARDSSRTRSLGVIVARESCVAAAEGALIPAVLQWRWPGWMVLAVGRVRSCWRALTAGVPDVLIWQAPRHAECCEAGPAHPSLTLAFGMTFSAGSPVLDRVMRQIGRPDGNAAVGATGSCTAWLAGLVDFGFYRVKLRKSVRIPGSSAG